MGCLEDKPHKWDRPGKYRCAKCRATADKKSKLCKPEKIKTKAEAKAKAKTKAKAKGT